MPHGSGLLFHELCYSSSAAKSSCECWSCQLLLISSQLLIFANQRGRFPQLNLIWHRLVQLNFTFWQFLSAVGVLLKLQKTWWLEMKRHTTSTRGGGFHRTTLNRTGKSASSGLKLMMNWSAGKAFLSFFIERELFLKAKVNVVIERTLMHSHVKWSCDVNPEGEKALNELEREFKHYWSWNILLGSGSIWILQVSAKSSILVTLPLLLSF